MTFLSPSFARFLLASLLTALPILPGASLAQSDSTVLLAIYHANGYGDPYAADAMSSDVTWENGRAVEWRTSLNIGMTADIPDQIGLLTALRVLEFHQVQFPVLPGSIRNLKSLESFSLLNNPRPLDLPVDLLTLPNLRKLYIAGCDSLKHPPTVPKDLSIDTVWLGEWKTGRTLPAWLERNTGLKELDIGDFVTALPPWIGSFKQLRKLVLFRNRLTSLPREICGATRLEILNVEGGGIPELPGCMGELTRLDTLRLAGNKLKSLPQGITGFPSLRYLDVALNELDSLPAGLGQLTALKYLNVRSNKLTSLPSSISNLKSLESLDVSANLLRSLPETLFQLPRLGYIFLKGNRLESLPDVIYSLDTVVTLDLADNRISSLPAGLLKIKIRTSIVRIWSGCLGQHCYQREYGLFLGANKLCGLQGDALAWANANAAPGWEATQVFCNSGIRDRITGSNGFQAAKQAPRGYFRRGSFLFDASGKSVPYLE